MKPTLIFDYDGTIHNTIVIYEAAFRRCYEWLVEEGYTEHQEISSERIAGWLGINSREMWNSFLPQLSQDMKEAASRRVGADMVERIRTHQAVWYPGAEKVLDELKAEGYPMVILSNCKIAYREANWKEFSMQRWFLAFYDCESYGFAPKTQIIKELQKNFPGPFIVIGDRYSDLECAKACKSPFVGCTYGFGKKGELEGADLTADSIQMLPKQIRSLEAKRNWRE